MQTDFWLERWEQNQIGFHEEDINPHLQRFWAKFKLPAQSKIFVPLCGKSKDIVWLLAQGYQVVGVELSPLAVQSFFSENQLTAQISDHGALQVWKSNGLSIYLGNFFELRNTDLTGCNAIYDRASLIALPPKMREQYTQHLKSIVPNLDHTLLITLEYDQSQMQGPPFSVSTDEVYNLFGHDYQIECLFSAESLEQNEQFKQRGLTQLIEKAYWLKQRLNQDVK